MLSDPRGCPVSTDAATAITHAEHAQWRMLTYFGDPFEDLDAAMQEDPAWALPLVMKANCLLSAAEFAPAQQAQALLDKARELAARGCANARERDHIDASAACAAGQWRTACDLWERILVQHPRDLVALSAAHLFDFYRGDSRNLQRRVARVLPAWSESDPLYAHALALHAFGLEECNHYDRALETAHAALALQPREPWAVHAIAHVHEMRGEYDQGAAFLQSSSQDWAPDNGFAFHNWWHLALFQLERMDTAAALALFDERIAEGTDLALQHVDVCAMLWRLQLLGVDVGDRWQQASARWPAAAPDRGHYAFNDFHAAMAYIGAGKPDQARQVLEAVQRRSAQAQAGEPGWMAAEVGVPLLRGLVQYAEADFAGATEQLLGVREHSHKFGGSHAQRDIIELTLLDAAVRAGHKPLARHLLNERLLTKSQSPLTEHWARRVA
ncbi:tetratricopeptide repeat protein [Pseudoxanthomonas wuyuanensis]